MFFFSFQKQLLEFRIILFLTTAKQVQCNPSECKKCEAEMLEAQKIGSLCCIKKIPGKTLYLLHWKQN